MPNGPWYPPSRKNKHAAAPALACRRRRPTAADGAVAPGTRLPDDLHRRAGRRPGPARVGAQRPGPGRLRPHRPGRAPARARPRPAPDRARDRPADRRAGHRPGPAPGRGGARRRHGRAARPDLGRGPAGSPGPRAGGHDQHHRRPAGAAHRRGLGQRRRHRHRGQGPGRPGGRLRRHRHRHRRHLRRRALHTQEREEEFAGPRSVWGARIARAVHAAVQAGAAGYAATLNGRTQ